MHPLSLALIECYCLSRMAEKLLSLIKIRKQTLITWTVRLILLVLRCATVNISPCFCFLFLSVFFVTLSLLIWKLITFILFETILFLAIVPFSTKLILSSFLHIFLPLCHSCLSSLEHDPCVFRMGNRQHSKLQVSTVRRTSLPQRHNIRLLFYRRLLLFPNPHPLQTPFARHSWMNRGPLIIALEIARIEPLNQKY